MQPPFIIDRTTLDAVNNQALFYPGCGDDWRVPLELFSPYIVDFWFVDRGYFLPGHQDTRWYGFDRPADEQVPLLAHDARYAFLKKAIQGPVSGSPRQREITPCIVTETYGHLASQKIIRIHRRRGYGFSALRTDIPAIGVFFYRGDSAGEGGSGNLWLNPEHLDEICRKLCEGGLLVLDGSDGSPFKRGTKSIYREFWRHQWNADTTTNPDDWIAARHTFTDRQQRQFSCVGYAGQKYGPTLIWQCHQNKPAVVQ